MVDQRLIVIGGGLILVGAVFFLVPIPSDQTPSLGVPAPGFEDVPEMIVEEVVEEPVTMFCRIYPGSVRCN